MRMRWAYLHGSVEGKHVRQLWLEQEGEAFVRHEEHVLKPVQSVTIWISLSPSGIVLQPLQAKMGGRHQALELWQPAPCAVMLR